MASVNFITAHDGFTLRDLVSYNEPHNEANGEEGGESHNRSWNCGVEGDTDDEAVLDLRARQVRNFLVTLLVSQGVPMLLAGDELGRTQQGNNNAYCQDNEISWFDWEHADRELLDFTTKLVRLRREHPVLRRRNWFAGHPIGHDHADDLPDITWHAPDGSEMSEDQWAAAYAKSLTVFLNGKAISFRDRRGEPIVDDSFLLLFNAHHEDVQFTLPDARWGEQWTVEVDTAANDAPDEPVVVEAGAVIDRTSRSVAVLRRLEPEAQGA
jgi:isoamylase